MTNKKIYSAFIVAVVLAVGVGFVLARWMGPARLPVAVTDAAQNTPAAGETDDKQNDDHAEDEAEEGVVTLSAEQIEATGLDVVAVTRGGGASTRLSGRVEPMVGARAAVAAATGGRIERVLVAPGSQVRAGTSIAIIISGDGASLRATADAAAAEAEAARLSYQRDRHLVEQGVVARQEMEASNARAMAANANVRAAQARIAAAGRPDARGRIAIVSPVSGVVGSVMVTPGGFVAAGDVVANIANPEQSELVFNAVPALASHVTPGMRMDVTGPDGSFPAIVTAAAADVSEPTGMALIRARAETGRLPPSGSPVSAVLVTGGSGGAFVVPADAVQNVEGRSVVFVADGGNRFRAVQVMVGRRAGDRVEIVGGLQGDERIVGSNAFLLKAELAKGDAEHGH